MARVDSLTIRLSKADNVVVAKKELPTGTEIPEEKVKCISHIPAGHKVSVTTIISGARVLKYGQIIGYATRIIRPGEHVHTHNLSIKDFAQNYDRKTEATEKRFVKGGSQKHFLGIVRPDGRIATRNYIGVLSTVNCAASVARSIASYFDYRELASFSSIDGVVPLCHGTGCGMVEYEEGFKLLQRTITGYLRHPNFGGVLIVGLGCEDNQIDMILQRGKLPRGGLVQTLTIQKSGGTKKAIRNGIACIKKMLLEANRVERRLVPASHIILGLECGGSDAYSGITANPALGHAVDLLVGQGGTSVLSETPEIYGAEHLLRRRTATKKVEEKLINLIKWWEEYVARNGGEIDNNPSPGNKEGGLSTILEKSLGAVAKGGTSELKEVYRYAQPVATQGLVFMDTPGFDPVSVTGMVAGGANVICFTTGRGSVFGCKPVPVIKLASHSVLFNQMKNDMDINCGEIIDGKVIIEEMGERIFRLILKTASGKKTNSEKERIGDNEFVPWQIGAVL